MGILLRALLACALVVAPAFGDPTDRIEIVVKDAASADPHASRPVNGGEPAEAAAEAMFRRLLREDTPLRRHALDALARLDAHRAAPPASGLRFNGDGRIPLMMDMALPGFGGGAAAAFRADPRAPNDLQVYILKGAGGMQGVTPEGSPRLVGKMHEYLVHEMDHVNLLFAELDHVARRGTSIEERLIFQRDNAGHSFLTPSDPRNALVEGMAEALQLHHFGERSFLARAAEQAHAEASLWTGWRPGEPAGRMQRWAESLGLRRAPADAPAMGAGAGAETPTLRTAAQMQANEGVVALVLADLYGQGLATPEGVRDALARSGATDLDGLLRELKSTAEPATAARIDAARSRRLLGADVDYARARSLFERRVQGQLSPDAYARAVDSLVRTNVERATGQRLPPSAGPAVPRLGDDARGYRERALAEHHAQAPRPQAEPPSAPRAAAGETPAPRAGSLAALEEARTPRALAGGGLAGAGASLHGDLARGGIFVAPVIATAMGVRERVARGMDSGRAFRETLGELATTDFLVGNVLAGVAGAAAGSAIPLPAVLARPGVLAAGARAFPAFAGAMVVSEVATRAFELHRQGRLSLGELARSVDWTRVLAQAAGSALAVGAATTLLAPALIAATTLGPFALIPIAAALGGAIAADHIVDWLRRPRARPPAAREPEGNGALTLLGVEHAPVR